MARWLNTYAQEEYLLIYLSIISNLPYLIIYLWLYSPFLCLGLFFSFLIFLHGGTPWTGIRPPQGRYMHTGTAQTQNKRKQASMPQVGFERTIPVFE
jgi:hypothetical protein